MSRLLYKIIGLFFVVLACLGAVFPLLPTTPFLLVAAACFAKSSPYLYQKLLDNRVFGPMIRDWQAHRSIGKRAKTVALITMVLAYAWSFYLLEPWYLRAILTALMLWPFIFVARLPLTEHQIVEKRN
ncbi:YbaN family protein [Thalassotalea agarivorans]|uniref:Inner membrane protein n=1 Tax=Thalassotalea agarivorans TaxID=349064 RepID=A0A1H9ZF60_THASX|nr:YbaN family protein [Thalassotalea agarivorans]SES79474.1 hypothetical protein SAMN05660429_00404 [Thalassotalea agarivorans]